MITPIQHLWMHSFPDYRPRLEIITIVRHNGVMTFHWTFERSTGLINRLSVGKEPVETLKSCFLISMWSTSSRHALYIFQLTLTIGKSRPLRKLFKSPHSLYRQENYSSYRLCLLNLPKTNLQHLWFYDYLRGSPSNDPQNCLLIPPRQCWKLSAILDM